jgi:hypothetical protein
MHYVCRMPEHQQQIGTGTSSARKRRRERPPVLGPVLHFRGVQAETGRWRLSVLYVLEGEDEPPDLLVEGVGLPVPPRHLARHGDLNFWRFDFAVPRGPEETRVGYGFPDGTRRYLNVPSTADIPHIAYASCNGSEGETLSGRMPTGRNAMWAQLLGRHRARPFHLLLQGGDQLYADSVWSAGPALSEWSRLSWRDRLDRPFTPEMAAEAEDFYVGHYLRLWRQAEIAALFATVPSVMMWDDHDIFDGWGSHPEERHACPVYQGVYAVARQCFSLFQMGMDPAAPVEACWGAELGSFSQGYRMGKVGLLVLDLRSERRLDRVLSDRTWAELPGWLDRFAGAQHLLVMSSVPLAFVNLHAVERIVNALPGQAALEDDLRDQWRSYVHEAEWLRLLRLLGDVSVRRRLRITILSGEVHLGHAGIVRGPGHELRQLTASGIAHPPPGRMYVEVLERLARGVETVRDGLTIELPAFTRTGRRFIRNRNWLELAPEEDGRLVAHWHVEGEREPLSLDLPGAPR